MQSNTYTDPNSTRQGYRDERKDHGIMKMVLPLIIGLALGFGVGKASNHDNANHDTSSGASQQQSAR